MLLHANRSIKKKLYHVLHEGSEHTNLNRGQWGSASMYGKIFDERNQ